MKNFTLSLLLAAACASAQQAPTLPSWLSPKESPAKPETDVQVYTWTLPAEVGAIEFVFVPAGDEGFWIARTEITWAVFKSYCDATGRSCPPLPDKKHWDHPVNNVTWSEAKAFCGWAGLALPSEAEWQRAARGTDGRSFPWGAASPTPRGNFCDVSCPEGWEWKEADRNDGFAYTAPVGSFPAGVAQCGALDMAGNVWEWCEPAEKAARVARGGGWCSPTSTGQTTSRRLFDAQARWAGLGFRPVLRARPQSARPGERSPSSER